MYSLLLYEVPVPALDSVFSADVDAVLGLEDLVVVLPSAARFSFFACFLAALMASSPPSDFHFANSCS